MTTQFDSNTFQHDYIVAVLGFMVLDLATDKPECQVVGKYASELTAFMNGQIAQAVKDHHA